MTTAIRGGKNDTDDAPARRALQRCCLHTPQEEFSTSFHDAAEKGSRLLQLFRIYFRDVINQEGVIS